MPIAVIVLSLLVALSRSSVCRPDAITSSSLLPIRVIVFFDIYIASLNSLPSHFYAMPSGLCRNDPPRRMMAQTMRASLFATATVTTRAGLRASNAFTHPANSGLSRA